MCTLTYKLTVVWFFFFFFSSRRRHTRFDCDWSSDVCSSDVGIFDVLKRKSPIEKLAKEVKEPFAQPEYRREAMEKLFKMGTEEAYQALLMRFTVAASGAIADEDEKREMVDRLVEVGAPALGPVKTFIRTQQKITFPVRA